MFFSGLKNNQVFTSICKILLFPFAILFLILIRILRPIILIRLGFFYIQRIGHFAFDLEMYLSEKQIKNDKNTFDIFFLSGDPCNSYLYDICKQNVLCISGFSFIVKLNEFLPFSEVHQYKPAVIRTASRDINGILKNTPSQTNFNFPYRHQGHDLLRHLNIKEDMKFVCLTIRDSAYLKNEFPEKDFSYHDYRDTQIEDYSESINYLISQNYFVFRMGKKVSKKLELDSENFFDYANSSFRSDFLDIWLMSNCEFVITNGTGLDEICNIKRLPMCYVNYIPLLQFVSYNKKAICTPKTIYNHDDKTPMSLSDQILKGFINEKDMQEKKPIIKDNDSKIILGSVEEMVTKIKNDWRRTPEEEELQHNFWQILKTWKNFTQYHLHDDFRNSGSISDVYLKTNKDWLI